MNIKLKLLAIASLTALSSPSWALFSECPAYGADAGCGVLITINPDLSLSFTADATQGPYDGNDDTLVGVFNNSGTTVTSFNLTSTTNIYGFDGDGVNTYGAPGNTTDTSGYGAPQVFYTNIDPTSSLGTVNIIGGLAAGKSTYFSLEENITGANSGGAGNGLSGGGVSSSGGGVPPTTAVPEPSTYALFGLGLFALAGVAQRRKAVV